MSEPANSRPEEHGVADDVGGALRPHGKHVHRGALDAILQREGDLQRIEVFGIEDGRQSRTVDRPFGGHGVLAHVAGVGHLLGQHNDFQLFFHKRYLGFSNFLDYSGRDIGSRRIALSVFPMGQEVSRTAD